MGTNTATDRYVLFGRRSVASRRQGFSLIELITAIAVISILSTLTVIAVSKAKMHSETAKAVAGARVLINAFMSYGADNGGTCFIGYDSTPHAYGDVLKQQALTRYPFRLSPYYDESYEGPMWVNGNKEQIDESTGGKSHPQYAYSQYPAFGMNYLFVGGERLTYRDRYRNETYDYSDATAQNAILHHGEAESQIIVFASAGGDGIDGYHVVTPPNLYAGGYDGHKSWNSVRNWKPESKPEGYGHVNARYDGKAVIAQMGGSVQLRTIEELADMRLWAREAILENNRNHQPVYSPVIRR